jgi:DNA-directed RNA polymerase subunit M/transcription elongation factor TFIIS
MTAFYVHSLPPEHVAGNVICNRCKDWYPAPCKCGGLIHVDEKQDVYGEYVNIYKCDKCGHKYKYITEYWLTKELMEKKRKTKEERK